MLQYKAGYKCTEYGVHAQVIDFPAAITCGKDLDHARWMLASALTDVAESFRIDSLALPKPNPLADDPEMDIIEGIHFDQGGSLVTGPPS